MSDIRYPVGPTLRDRDFTPEKRELWTMQIAEAPAMLRQAVSNLSQAQLDTPIREGAWTPRQLVHHLCDSHVNAYIRLRLALTETDPVIKPYDQDQWSNLADALVAPIEPSLKLLDGLHARWVYLLERLPEEAFQRQFIHPEMGPVSLGEQLGIYAWHGRHHVAQIREAAERLKW